MKKVTPADRYLARRLLTFSKVKENDTLTAILQTIKKEATFTWIFESAAQPMEHAEERGWSIQQYWVERSTAKIDHESKRLPKQYQETELSILANQIGERETTNNPFGLKNDFYTHRIRAHEPELKQSQKLGLSFFARIFWFSAGLGSISKNHNEVLFIIPPVNEKWSDYTGLSQEMLQGFAKRSNFN